MPPLENLLAQANSKPHQSKAKLVVHGNLFSIRAPFPPKQGKGKRKWARLSLGLKATPEALNEAIDALERVDRELCLGTFSWPSKAIDAVQPSINQAIEAFAKAFYSDPRRTNPLSAKSTYDSAYLPYFNRICKIAIKLNSKKVSQTLIIETIKSTTPKTASRKNCITALKQFAKFHKINLPENINDYNSNYSVNQTKDRKVPSIKEIEAVYDKIQEPVCKYYFALMAIFGIRNHECFHCELRDDNKLLVGENTKTGMRIVRAINNDWIERFEVHTNKNRWPFKDDTIYQNSYYGSIINLLFRRNKIPFRPYDLRHAFAHRLIDADFHLSIAAKLMGHSVEQHCKTYHHHLNEHEIDREFDKKMNPKQLEPTIEPPQETFILGQKIQMTQS